MSGAWSKGTNKAVSAPPSSLQQAAAGNDRFRGGGSGRGRGGGWNSSGGRSSRRDSSTSIGSDGPNGGRGGRGRGGRGNRRSSYSDGDRNNRRQSSSGNRNRSSNSNSARRMSTRKLMKEIQLLEDGAGETLAQQSVKRIPARVFMSVRMNYVDPPPNFNPHEQCLWTDDDRMEQLRAWSMKAIELGDVTKKSDLNKIPSVQEVKPLQVNEETRWKPKLMQSDADKNTNNDNDTVEAVVAKALLILNKVSWTTIDRLSVRFMQETNVAENADNRKACIEMLVHKSQREHHFGPMYAKLCANVSAQIKQFKKELLRFCHDEFVVDTNEKIAQVTKDMDDPDEKEYHAGLIRKAYIGHIKFLGELYVLDVFKLKNMMECLDVLLKDDSDDENIECFAHLMTTMGQKLEEHAKQNNQPFDWDRVTAIMDAGKISKRVHFLLRDVLELRDRGWVKRRNEDKAKTLEQIHDEIAQEEQKQQFPSNSKTNRRASHQPLLLRRSSSIASAAILERAGSVEAAPQKNKEGLKRDSSSSFGGKDMRHPIVKRSQSQPVSMSSSSHSSTSGMEKPAPGRSVKSPEECSTRIGSILKEFLVGGDLNGAVLSVQELLTPQYPDGLLDRETKVVEGGVLLVMEMKEKDMTKCLDVFRRCVVPPSSGGDGDDGKNRALLSADGVKKGLADPLEFLTDIEIDAPLARQHLAKILSELVSLPGSGLTLDLLLEAPEFFRTDGRAADLACRVLKNLSRDPTDSDVRVVESLMTESDKEKYPSGKEMVAAIVGS